MAHIDDQTKVDSMASIFDRFIKNSVELKDVKVTVYGGWQKNTESLKWGKKIRKKIHDSGFVNVSTKNMYLKQALTGLQLQRGISKSDIHNHYHLGALLDAKTGKLSLASEILDSLEKEQVKQTTEFLKKNSSTTEVELTQVEN